jgi:N,N'-diacetyllegionaminate synthase
VWNGANVHDNREMEHEMKIRDFDLNKEVLVIAEIGNNHEGSFEMACELVHKAAAAGAHAVKFQTFRTELFINRDDSARFNRLKAFELSQPAFRELSAMARGLGVLFISTPLDLESAEFLTDIVDAFKIASGDNTFYPLLERVAMTGKPMIVSTGMAEIDQVRETINFVRNCRAKSQDDGDVALLHCVSGYPVPPSQASLNTIRYLAEQCNGITVGYSDHTLGIDACLLAVALGARIIEKHFTLNKAYSEFRDHQLSADPAELSELVKRVAMASSMLGESNKRIQDIENSTVKLARRSIAARHDLPKGHAILPGDLMWVRPAGGIPPGQETLIMGRKLRRDISFSSKILMEDLE